jgi:predicted ArsR family transcriptional regulator
MDPADGPGEDDVLASPVRSRLFDALVGRRGPATTDELARAVGRHPNNARLHLQRLEAAGLVESRKQPQRRGRPRDVWTVAAEARPGGAAREAYADLGRWLARATRDGAAPSDVEAAGEEIGRELAPTGPADRSPRDAMHDVLSALGFAPRSEDADHERVRFVLRNCPYRDAVAENQPVVCALHRGITRGVLGRLAPQAELAAFVPRDPYRAGCVVDVVGI